MKTIIYRGANPDIGAAEVGDPPLPPPLPPVPPPVPLPTPDPTPAPVQPPLTSLQITKKSGEYVITGSGLGGARVSWHGASRANALLTLEKFAERLV